MQGQFELKFEFSTTDLERTDSEPVYQCLSMSGWFRANIQGTHLV